MKPKPKLTTSARETEPATQDEINQAIEGLTQEDAERIEQSAQNRIYRIGRAAASRREAKELIDEAVTRILDGRRNWYKDKVTFTVCLIGVIWSIASEWAGHRERNKEHPEYARLESDLAKMDDQGKFKSPFDTLQDPNRNPEQELVRVETEAENKVLAGKIGSFFAEDEQATILILGFQDGMDAPAIRTEFGLTEKQFKSAMLRIRRKVKEMMEQHHGR